MYFDTHAHYDDSRFDDDRDALLASLPEKGVGRIVNCGSDAASSRLSLALAEKYPHVWAAAGIHPESAGDYTPDDLLAVEALLKEDKVVAVGEIGLDYYYEDAAPREVQLELLRIQLRLAAEKDLPVVIHDREAHADSLMAVKEVPNLRGVFHCYSGSVEMALELTKMGWLFSFGGAVTFKNARKAPEVIAALPPDRILLETDCPYLAPVPFRGKRCDSSLLPYTAAAIASFRGMTVEEIEALTWENACRFFDLCIGDRAGVLVGALLVVIRYLELHVGREEQSRFRLGFDSPTAVGAPFVRSTSAERQHFRTVEEVLIAVVESGSHAPVSGAVSTFDLHAERVESSAGDGDEAVQQRVADGSERYIDVAHGCECVHARVCALHAPVCVTLVAVNTAHGAQRVLSQESLPCPTVLVAVLIAVVEQFHRIRQMARVVVQPVMYGADGVVFLYLRHQRRVAQHELRQVDSYVHFVRVERTVGCELQHRFLEIEITSVAHDGRYSVALFVQSSGGELLARMDFATRVARDSRHLRDRDVHFVMTEIIRFMRGHHVGQIDLAVLDALDGVHLGMEITHIVHLLPQLLHADAGLYLVVDDRCLAHLMRILRQFLLRLGGCVGRRGVVDMEL